MAKPRFSTSSAAVERQWGISLKQKTPRKSPWPFMLLMLLMLACMGASASIIVISDGQPVGSWTIEPAVLLAFISSIWNYMAGSLLGIAVTITWWRNFLRGTTVRNLHYIWKRGGISWFASLRAGVAARNVFLLASLIVLMQAINNPLLQRSTHVEAKSVTVEDTMMLNMVSQLPDGYLAVITNATAPLSPVIGIRPGLLVAQGWWWNKTMMTRNATGFQCDGVCKGTVQGTGLKYECNSTTRSLDFSAPESMGSVIFGMDTTITWDATGAPIVVLTTLHPSALDDSCVATINVDTCTIEAGLVEYPIVIQENTIALVQEKLDNMTVLSDYISPGDLSTAAPGQGAGPLQSINDYFGYLYTSTVLQSDPVTNNTLYSGDDLSDFFFEADESNYNKSIIDKCGLLFSSPTSYSLQFMHEFLFRASLQASTDADAQTFDVQRSDVQLIFRSNYHYLTAVLAAMLVTLLGLLSQVWAWWELGWNVTMSPIETANAFGAPAMQQGGGRAAKDILNEAGDVRVKYGGESHASRVDMHKLQT